LNSLDEDGSSDGCAFLLIELPPFVHLMIGFRR
jgi:hypothetical protein